MEHFNTIIQLVAGVNFVFILSNFLDKTVNSLFGFKEHLDRGRFRYANKWLLDEETAKTLEINTQDGHSNRQDLKKLALQYKRIANVWEKGCNWLEYVNNAAKSRLGFQTLFLIGSIYSICDLLLISLTEACPESSNFLYSFIAISGLIYFAIEICILFCIIGGTVKDIQEENLRYAFIFIVLIILGFVAVLILDGYKLTQYITLYTKYVKYMALVLPCIPCVVGILYIGAIETLNMTTLKVLSAYCNFSAWQPNKRKRAYMNMVQMCKENTTISYE